MSLGLYERRVRRRRQFWWAVIKWTFALLLVLAAAVYAYQSATLLAERKVKALEADIDRLTTRVAELQDANLELEKAAGDARWAAEQWQARYQRDVPTGELERLLGLVEEKLNNGADAERLEFLIRASEREPECDEEVVSRRFIVRTPLTASGNDVAAFGDNAITVTAIGQSAINEEGRREAWYDPDQPVTVVFTALGGQTSQADGVLPLHHSMVFSGSEYRFSMLPGQRGFLQVTAQRCDFP